jgi:hypothetical protein
VKFTRRVIVLVLVAAIVLLGGALWGIQRFWSAEHPFTQIAEAAASALENLGGISFLPTVASDETEFLQFDKIVVDPNNAGDVKLVGDIDGDNYPDLIIGGMPHEQLNWYRYPDWKKTAIASPSNEFTTDGALGDVDGDGDLDIVVPDGDGPENLLWFENPLPSGQPTDGAQWKRHVVGTIGSWGKDVELADFDGNGRLDVAARDHGTAMIFFQNTANTWQRVVLEDVTLGSEGMASGDIDGDGHVDLVLQGVWLRNPGNSAAQTPTEWTEYPIGTANADFKALVVDLDQDGQMDVLFSSSENQADVDWWTPESGDPTGAWIKRTIVPSLEKAHTLQAADMDLDGDVDVVIGQMHTSSEQEIMIMFNVDGQATTWRKQTVDIGGLHNGVVADIGNDGDYDIYGANWTGNPPVRLWENRLDGGGLMGNWAYFQITDDHTQTFGLGFGDIDGDGQQDIVSGRHWYRNPGSDLTGAWAQSNFPDDVHAFSTLDVDGDAKIDLLAQKDEGDIGLYWLEAVDEVGTTWTTIKVGAVERASHGLGAQGYRTAVFNNGAQKVVLITSGNGIYYFVVPNNPEIGNWPRVHVNSNPSDEGFAVGDINDDGALDIAATTGDSKRVEWYQNPGNGTGEWQPIHVGNFDEAVYPDRTELADLNGDGLLDIIVTEENGEDADAQTIWWEQPADSYSPNWSRHPLVTQATTNSLDVADMDGDGDMDVVLAEHRGEKKLSIWINDGQGNFSEQPVGAGVESHLGGRTVDLDADGDLDIVSIAWDEPQYVHVWRNDQVLNKLLPSATTAVMETSTGNKWDCDEK